MKNGSKSGFTLVECLLVSAIIISIAFFVLQVFNKRQVNNIVGITSSHVLSDSDLERKHGFASSVIGTTSFSPNVEREENTNSTASGEAVDTNKNESEETVSMVTVANKGQRKKELKEQIKKLKKAKQ